MGSMSLWHWPFLVVWLLVIGVPVARVLRRIGFSPWWTIVAFLPLANIVALWVLAFMRWPGTDRSSEPAP